MDKTKVCCECVKRKKLEMFEKRKDTGRYRRSCRECCSVKAMINLYKRKNPSYKPTKEYIESVRKNFNAKINNRKNRDKLKTKVCNCCGKRKSVTKFRFRSEDNFLQGRCKDCERSSWRGYYYDNSEWILEKEKEFKKNNKEHCSNLRYERRQKNLEEIREKDLQRYYENREAFSARRSELRRQNLEKYQQKEREYYQKKLEENPDYYRASGKRYYYNNKEKEAQRAREYRKNNPDIMSALDAKRRAFQLNATPQWLTKEHFNEILKKYTRRDCKNKNLNKEKYHVDHIVPLCGVDEKGNRNVSGLHVPWNLRVLKSTTNLQKNNKFYGKWVHFSIRKKENFNEIG